MLIYSPFQIINDHEVYNWQREGNKRWWSIWYQNEWNNKPSGEWAVMYMCLIHFASDFITVSMILGLDFITVSMILGLNFRTVSTVLSLFSSFYYKLVIIFTIIPTIKKQMKRDLINWIIKRLRRVTLKTRIMFNKNKGSRHQLCNILFKLSNCYDYYIGKTTL